MNNETNNVLTPEMIIIPEGSFKMGDLSGTGSDNEKPIHLVTFTKPFAISSQVVTFNEYERYATDTGKPLPSDEGWGKREMPIINVSWEDAATYAIWLSEKCGVHFRLPSEAEWEYAARAGSETDYWWGQNFDCKMANCDIRGSQWGGIQTSPIRSFPPNPFGLYDMTGNVWEWVQDRWHENYENAPDDGSAWETGDSFFRVLRGGCWYDTPNWSRNSCRLDHPGYEHKNRGFRLACSL